MSPLLSRALLGALLVAAGCGKREDRARGVPNSELAHPAPSVSATPRCEPACELGSACVEGMCAEGIDWAARAITSVVHCPIGERHAVTCGARTAPMPVWGSDVYTTDSSVCAAALHAGKIAPSGGDAIYDVRAGQPSYVGSSRNGVTTGSWNAYECSFVFISKGCAAGATSCGKTCANLRVDDANCGACGAACAPGETCRKGVCSPGLDATYATVAGEPCTGTRTYVCPPRGGANVGSVWGTTIYTNDSSVCGAAVHAGVFAESTGGLATIELLPGLPAYTASTRHGITSRPWAAWSCSFRFRP